MNRRTNNKWSDANHSPEQLELFARHVEDRARYRPRACDGGANYGGKRWCWVESGPPAYDGAHCVGCKGPPRFMEIAG
jgi:hypothetical protein